MDRPFAGAVAGLVATLPMTLVMKGLYAQLPAREQFALPPRRITMRAARKVGLAPALGEPQRKGLTYAAHFGYGAAAGTLFGLWAPNHTGRAVAGGVGFGLAVWAVSYLGLLPALGLHPSATRDAARRNALMIVAHVVWGATLGALTGPLRRADTHA